MNILITGADGQLGSQLRSVVKSDRDKYDFTDITELDITDRSALEVYIVRNGVEVIVNCAAYTNVDGAEESKATADLLNNRAVGNLAEVAKKAGATLIHISTDYLFDGNGNTPYTETSPTSPTGVYGETKLAGELAIQNIDCNYIIIRTSWLYSQFGSNFVKTILELSAERNQLNVIFDQIGTPTYAADLAEVICHIIDSEQLYKKGIYHFSNEGICSWYDFAVEIATLSGNVCDIRPCRSSDFPTKAKRPSYSVLDKTKIKESFGIAIPHWREALVRCITKK